VPKNDRVARASLNAARLGALLLAVLPLGLAAASGTASVSRDAYRIVLDRLLTATGTAAPSPAAIATLAETLPTAWRVEAGPRTFDVDADWIRRDLLALARTPSGTGASRLHDRLRQLRDELDAYDASPRDVSRESDILTRILADGEFAGVAGPGWIDRFRQGVLSFIVGLLASAFGESSFPTVGRVLVYVLVGLAVAAIAAWLYRGFRGQRLVPSIVPEELPVSARQWTAWLADARASADGGRWRDAVRLAYWAGISFLESQRLWPADRARTPREYLRLLAAGSEHRPPLAALTHRFEVVWYGRHEADAHTFAAALDELEKLGCRHR